MTENYRMSSFLTESNTTQTHIRTHTCIVPKCSYDSQNVRLLSGVQNYGLQGFRF